MTIRVLIADDHNLVREGLRLLLQSDPAIEVVGEAANGDDAVGLVRQLRPDVVLMDLLMPGLDGVAATTAIRNSAPETKVLILTSVPEDHGVVQVVRAGAIGYLLKDVEASQLRRAIKAAAVGQVQLSPRATKRLVREMRKQEQPESLTDQESRILLFLAEGFANKEIASDLGIAETTVKSHVRHILAKLGVRSRTQAALLAVHDGLVATAPTGASDGAGLDLCPVPLVASAMPVNGWFTMAADPGRAHR